MAGMIPRLAEAPWKRLGLTTLTIAIFAFFWINGPLQAPQPVFEFEEHVTGFSAPVRVGEEKAPPQFGVIGHIEEHPYYRILTAKARPPKLHGVIGDARNSPSLKPEVADLVLYSAKALANDPDRVKLHTALDMFYTEETDATGKLVQLYFENTGLNRNVKGYAGPIDIGLVVGPEGKIHQVKYLRSEETTSYLKKIANAGFYEQFRGIPLDGNSYQVDAVSGASLTTEAIARSVSKLVSIGSDSPLQMYIDTDPAGFDIKAILPDTWMLNAALIAALFVVTGLKKVRRSTRLSLVLTIVSVLYLGFHLNNSFTYVTFMHPFLGIGWTYVLGIYAALVLAGAIWGGNTYCRHVCPYGNLQRLMIRVTPKKFRGSLPMSNRMLNLIRWTISGVLALGIAAGLQEWGSFELFPDLFGLEWLESSWFWVSAAVILLSTYYPMLWCRMLCPTGSVLDIIASLARPSRASKRKYSSALAGIPVTIETPGP